MGPLQYIKQRRLQRKHRQDAIKLLAKSGVLRSANHQIRYSMTPKELKRLFAGDTTDAIDS
jgi:hypothetical protein